MSYAAVIGGVAAIGGSAIAGMSAADAADAQAEALRNAQGQQYAYGNSARFRAMGDFFGGDGLRQRILGSASDEDIDAQFGRGAAAFMRLPPDQQTMIRQGRQAPGAVNPKNRLFEEFNATYKPGQFWNGERWVDPGGFGTYQGPRDNGNEYARAAQRESEFAKFIKRRTGQDLTNEELQAFRYNQQLPIAQDPGFDPSKLDEFESMNGGKGIINEYGDLAKEYGQRGKQALFDFDADSGALQSMADRNLADTMTQYKRSANDIYGKATGMESLVKDWGAGRERIIDEDAQRGLAQANAVSQAQLAARGFNGSTLINNATNANAMEMSRNTARAKQDLSDSRIDRQTSARGQAVNLYANSMGAMDDVYGKFKGTNVDRAYTRAAQKMAMSQDNMNRDLSLQQIPLSLRGNLAMSSLMNPGTTINTASFVPTATGAGMVGSALGSTLAGMGGQAWGSWLAGGNSNRSSGSGEDYRNDPNYQWHMQEYGD